MSDAHESAKLILKLYSLRREQRLRDARDWVHKFNPKTIKDIEDTAKSQEGAKLWMVIGYWEMASALVNHGAIDDKMFSDTNFEHVLLYAKLQQFLPEMRKMDPHILMNTEKLIMKNPNAGKMLDDFRKMAMQWEKK